MYERESNPSVQGLEPFCTSPDTEPMDAAFKQNNKKHNVQAGSLLPTQFSYELLDVATKFNPVISTFGWLQPTTDFSGSYPKRDTL